MGAWHAQTGRSGYSRSLHPVGRERANAARRPSLEYSLRRHETGLHRRQLDRPGARRYSMGSLSAILQFLSLPALLVRGGLRSAGALVAARLFGRRDRRRFTKRAAGFFQTSPPAPDTERYFS